MADKSRLAELAAAERKNVIVVRSVISFQGKSLFYCKQCCEFVHVATHHKGTGPSPFTGETIYWDWIEDDLGHTLEDWSH